MEKAEVFDALFLFFLFFLFFLVLLVLVFAFFTILEFKRLLGCRAERCRRIKLGHV